MEIELKITKKEESQVDDRSNNENKEDYSKVDISDIKDNNPDKNNEDIDNNNNNDHNKNNENSKYYTNNKYSNLASEINKFIQSNYEKLPEMIKEMKENEQSAYSRSISNKDLILFLIYNVLFISIIFGQIDVDLMYPIWSLLKSFFNFTTTKNWQMVPKLACAPYTISIFNRIIDDKFKIHVININKINNKSYLFRINTK